MLQDYIPEEYGQNPTSINDNLPSENRPSVSAFYG
jgi:hypothetical protein